MELKKISEELQGKHSGVSSLANFDHTTYTKIPESEILPRVESDVKRLFAKRHKIATEADIQAAYKLVTNYNYSCKVAEEYWQKVTSNNLNAIKFTNEQFRGLSILRASATQPKFQPSEIFDQLCEYFTGTGNLYPEKGILIFGSVGCGKTFLMELFKRNPKCSYIVRGCNQIAYEYAKEGFERIEFYSQPWKTYRNEFGQTTTGVCFDDLGTENQRKHFGDQVDVMPEILSNRYRNRELWAHTFATTNLTGKQLTEIYGERITSRFIEMFNIIKFQADAKDWRKENA